MTIEIADRLIKLRKKNGYSQEELADKLQVSRQAVSKWERGEASPDTDNLICLAKLYGVSLDELLSTDEDVDTIVKEQVKKETKDTVELEEDDGSKVIINNDGVKCFDKDGKPVKRELFKDKFIMVLDIIECSLFFGVLVTYILLGSLCNMWATTWMYLFLPGFVISIFKAIRKKNASKVNVVFLVLFVYFFVCMVYPGEAPTPLWHPTWIVFLFIPAYYIVVGSINKLLGKKDDEEDDD